MAAATQASVGLTRLELSENQVALARVALESFVEQMEARLSADPDQRELAWNFPCTVAMLGALVVDWTPDESDALSALREKLEFHAQRVQMLELDDDPAQIDLSSDPRETVPAELAPRYEAITELTDRFCAQWLDDEFLMICRRMAAAVCSQGTPAARGRIESWAAGVAAAVGWVNFLPDPTSEPRITYEDIAKWFGVSTPTVYAKTKIIREGLELTPLDADFIPAASQGKLQEVSEALMAIGGDEDSLQMIDPSRLGVVMKRLCIPLSPATPPQRVAASADDPLLNSDPGFGFQLKITLDQSKPPIWRRVIVQDCTLGELHDVIQEAMGWGDCHLHEFRLGDQRFVMETNDDFGPSLFDDERAESEEDVFLSELVVEGAKELRYWYDFGDDWWHTIKIEKQVDLSPDAPFATCVKGKGACPPEDIGGVWGYYHFLEAIDDPTHEQHGEYTEWYGDGFDPDAFDLEAVNSRLGEFEDDDA